MTEAQARSIIVASLKTQARRQNKARDWAALAETCRELERVWKHDALAQAFYTELENEHI